MKKRNNFTNQNPVPGFQSVQKSENIKREKQPVPSECNFPPLHLSPLSQSLTQTKLTKELRTSNPHNKIKALFKRAFWAQKSISATAKTC